MLLWFLCLLNLQHVTLISIKYIFRLRIKRDFKYFIRCLSDKPPDHDTKIPEIKSKEQKQEDTKSESSTEKIQALLKSMLAEPKITESEYREKFTTAPDRPKKPKRDAVEVEMAKIG